MLHEFISTIKRQLREVGNNAIAVRRGGREEEEEKRRKNK